MEKKIGHYLSLNSQVKDIDAMAVREETGGEGRRQEGRGGRGEGERRSGEDRGGEGRGGKGGEERGEEGREERGGEERRGEESTICNDLETIGFHSIHSTMMGRSQHVTR